MLVTGTLKCLHCGQLGGRWSGRAGTALVAAGLRDEHATGPAGGVLRCQRCRGPLFLDEAVAVRSTTRLRRIARLRRQVAELAGC